MSDGEPGSRAGSPARSSRSPDARILVWFGVAVGLLVIVAVVLTFVERPRLDPGTPEGVVQRYLQAVVEGRRSEARSYLSDRLQDECDSGFPRHVSRDAYRIEWVDTVVDGSEAWVDVLVAEDDLGVFGSYYEFDAGFTLQESADGWRITDQEWPWYGCSERMLDREEVP